MLLLTYARSTGRDVLRLRVLAASLVVVFGLLVWGGRVLAQDGITAQEVRNFGMTARLDNLERLNAGSRLAVLEQQTAQLDWMSKTLYASLFVLIANLATTVLQIRAQRK